MNRFTHWMATHSLLAKIIFSVFLCTVYTGLLVFLKVGYGGIVIFDLILILATICYVDSCSVKLLNAAIRVLNEQCDPYPLLQESKRQLASAKTGMLKQQLLINYYAAKVSLGEYQAVYEGLSAIHVDKYPGFSPSAKFVYYNNLSSVCDDLKLTDQAEIWYQKSLQLYQDLKSSKQKEQLRESMEEAKIQSLIRKQEYIQALQLLNTFSASTLYKKVHASFSASQIYLAQGMPEKAREHLQYVITHGNKLHVVTLAKELYQSITQS